MTHHDPYNGDVFVFMSKDRRKVKMVHFENHAYYIHEKVFTNGYRFMLLETHQRAYLTMEDSEKNRYIDCRSTFGRLQGKNLPDDGAVCVEVF